MRNTSSINNCMFVHCIWVFSTRKISGTHIVYIFQRYLLPLVPTNTPPPQRIAPLFPPRLLGPTCTPPQCSARWGRHGAPTGSLPPPPPLAVGVNMARPKLAPQPVGANMPWANELGGGTRANGRRLGRGGQWGGGAQRRLVGLGLWGFKLLRAG